MFFLKHVTAWLCLVLALVSGLTPAQGVVLCVEPDGGLCVETATGAAKCSDCDVEECGTDPSSSAAPADQHVVQAAEDECPCLDLAIAGTSQDRRIQPRPSKLDLSLPFAVAYPQIALPAYAMPAPTLVPSREVPHPPDLLALIRTVVLLV